MRINHRRRDIFVPQQLLDGADIYTRLQKMGGVVGEKGMRIALKAWFCVVDCEMGQIGIHVIFSHLFGG